MVTWLTLWRTEELFVPAQVIKIRCKACEVAGGAEEAAGGGGRHCAGARGGDHGRRVRLPSTGTHLRHEHYRTTDATRYVTLPCWSCSGGACINRANSENSHNLRPAVLPLSDTLLEVGYGNSKKMPRRGIFDVSTSSNLLPFTEFFNLGKKKQ